MLTRRKALVSLAAVVAAGCGRAATPAPVTPVVPFDVGLTGGEQVLSFGASGSTPAERAAPGYAATQQWFNPVLAAFNAGHPALQARFAPWLTFTSAQPQGQSNTGLSVLLGEYGGTDLTPQLRLANDDTAALWPGVLDAAQDVDGAIRGIPIDLAVGCVGYQPASAFGAAGVPAPQTGWSTEQFAAFCVEVAQNGGGFFGDLVPQTYGTPLGWLAYLQGYGGALLADGGLALTAPAALKGLNAFGDLLQTTWKRPETGATPLGVGLSSYSRTVPGMAPSSLARYPEAPTPVVPAGLQFASVPQSAPQVAAGETFVTWLITREGQAALTGIGFPPMRTDIQDAGSWVDKGPAAVRPADLRFAPPAVARLQPMQFTARLYQLLATTPASGRLAKLQTLEQVANAVLTGDLNALVAGAQLNEAGIAR